MPEHTNGDQSVQNETTKTHNDILISAHLAEQNGALNAEVPSFPPNLDIMDVPELLRAREWIDYPTVTLRSIGIHRANRARKGRSIPYSQERRFVVNNYYELLIDKVANNFEPVVDEEFEPVDELGLASPSVRYLSAKRLGPGVVHAKDRATSQDRIFEFFPNIKPPSEILKLSEADMKAANFLLEMLAKELDPHSGLDNMQPHAYTEHVLRLAQKPDMSGAQEIMSKSLIQPSDVIPGFYRGEAMPLHVPIKTVELLARKLVSDMLNPDLALDPTQVFMLFGTSTITKHAGLDHDEARSFFLGLADRLAKQEEALKTEMIMQEKDAPTRLKAHLTALRSRAKRKKTTAVVADSGLGADRLRGMIHSKFPESATD